MAEVLSLKNKSIGEEVVRLGSRREVKERWSLGNLVQFADDLMILVKGDTLESVRSKAAEAYSAISEWFLRNRLKLNSQKTHFMYVMTRQRAVGKDLEEPIIFDRDQVAPSRSERVLGITFDTNLSVKDHLVQGECSVLSQVSKKMRALWIIKKHLSFKSRKMTAWGLLMSKILYGIEVWGPRASEKELNQMQILQNNIMRWICCARRGTRTKDLLTMTGMLSIRQCVMYRILMTGLKVLWDGTPVGMTCIREEKIRRLATTKNSFGFLFERMFSKLPDSLTTIDPRKKKAEVKRWILMNIPWNRKWEALGDE